MKLTFKGGIHPYEGKELTMDKDVIEYVPKGDMVYPLSQHIGAPAKAVVKKGDRVLVGQLIAEAGGFVSANIHSSVSGTVKAVEPRLTASGSKVNSIVIENDNQFEEIEYVKNEKPLAELTKEEILEAIKNAGVVGMGGAGFPTNVKLSPKNADEIDYIIVNASECEPYLTSDYRRLLDETDKVIEGLRLALAIFPKAKGIIAVEDNKPKAIQKLKEVLGNDPDIKVNSMKTKYPEGAERQLIYANTGRYINSKMLPADAGCIVHNVDTVYSICEAVRQGKPLIQRLVTVTGDAITEPGNYLVRIGTSFAELIEAAGGFLQDPEKIIAGGPMMGKALMNLDVPVCKGSSGLLLMSEKESRRAEPQPCIRCAKCVSACPMGLEPYLLATASALRNWEKAEETDITSCIESGSCQFTCPSTRPMLDNIHMGKTTVMTLILARNAK